MRSQPLAALALVAACLGRPHWPDTLSLSPIPGGKRIWDVGVFASAPDWERTPWARPEDVAIAPVYVAVAEDGTACIVTADVWALAQSGAFVKCPTHWRMPRA